MLSWMLFVVLPCSTKQLFRMALRKIALQITYLSIGGHRRLSTWSVFFFFFNGEIYDSMDRCGLWIRRYNSGSKREH